MTFEEYKLNRLKGLDPEQAFSEINTENQQKGFSIGKTLENVPGSLGRFIGGIGNAVIHPIRTVKTLGKVGAGAIEKIIPGQQAEESYFDSLADVYKQNYGSIDGFLNFLQNDPIGVVSDLSTVLTGGGAIASKLGIVSKAGKVSSIGKIGGQLSKAGEIINPLSIVGKAGGGVQSLFPKIASRLEKMNWRLTKAKEGSLLTSVSQEGLEDAKLITKNKLDEIADYLSEQKIVGTPLTRYEKSTILYQKTEEVLDKFFSSIPKAYGKTKEEVTRGLSTLKGFYKGTRDYETISKQIDGAIKAVQKGFDGKIISYQNLNKFKRSTYANAYNKAGNKVIDNVEHAIGDVIRGQLDEGLRGLKIAGQSFEEFNHKYGLLIESRKILKSAIGKSQMSAVTERLLGGVIGYLVGAATGGVSAGVGGLLGAGFGKNLFETLPITGIRSVMGATAQKIGEVKIPQRIKNLKSPLTAVERIEETQ